MDCLKTNYFFDLTTYEHRSIFNDLNYVWEALARISLYLQSIHLGKIEIDIPEGVFLENPHLISIGKGSVVESGAYIKGPCSIGMNCVIRHGAYIRGNFIAGNHCVIGHDTEIKNVIFLDHTQAPHFAYIGDSILGNQVNLGAGVKCANLRLDNKNMIVHCEGASINTGLRKFGAIIGDHSQLGCNCVTNPGTLLGKNVKCCPVLNVGGFISSESFIKK